MSDFPLHTRDTAPEGARDLLAQVEAKFSFVPNLFGKLAESPAALETYCTLADIYGRTSLEPVEQQVVLLAISRENGCEYCVAAHSTGATMAGIPADIVTALRDGTPIADPKLEALRRFTERVVKQRGWLEPGDMEGLLAAGYGRKTVLDVLVGVAMKTFSNYVNHIVQTPLDQVFGPMAWKKTG